MTIDHSGKVLKDATLAPISIENMKNDTMAVTNYMARLGYGYSADPEKGKRYTHYDVADLVSGLEVPLWVPIVAGIIMLASLLTW